MAKILYEVKQNQIDRSAAYGKWFAYVKSLETHNTRKLAKHISEHGSDKKSVHLQNIFVLMNDFCNLRADFCS